MHGGRDVVLAIDLTESVGINNEGRLRLRQIVADSLQPGNLVYVVPFGSNLAPLKSEIIPQLQQGAQNYCAVTTLENLQRQIVDEPDTLSNVQVELTNLVDIPKQHIEQVKLGIKVLDDRMVNSNNYQSGV